MSGLPREVLRWLQSLALTFPVKNLRRDFANGYIVADIFSKFYPQEVAMHSFENAAGLSRKMANWDLLERFFRKHSIPISRAIINDVIHCRQDAAIPLVEAIYTFLTNKSIQVVRPVKDTTAPAYTRPTAAQVVREAIPTSEIPNAPTNQAKAAAALDQHKKQLFEKRLEDPAPRFPVSKPKVRPKDRSKKLEAMETRGSSHEVLFNEIQVRQVQTKVHQLRLGRPSVDPVQPESTNAEAQPTVGATPTPSDLSVMEVLSDCVQGHTSHWGEAETQARHYPDPVFSFVSELINLPDDIVSEVYANLSTKDDSLADACLSAPREFLKLFVTFLPVLHFPADSLAFASTINLLMSVGGRMVGKDAMVAEGFFRELVLPRIVQLLKGDSSKIEALLGIMYSYCANTVSSHISSIKALQELSDSMDMFVCCLSKLISMEASFSEDLLDLYMFYCVAGMHVSSPTVRAAALSMLTTIGHHRMDLVVGEMDRLEILVNDTWWEVQLQLLHIASMMIDTETQIESAIQIVQGVLEQRTLSPHVLSVGLASLARNMYKTDSLRQILVKSMLNAREDILSSLFEADLETSQLGNRALTREWHAATVARTVTAQVLDEGLESLEMNHLLIYRTALRSARNENIPEWQTWLDETKELIYASLCDEDVVYLASHVIEEMCAFLPNEASQTFPYLLTSLRLLFPHGPIECRQYVRDLLLALYRLGDPIQVAIHQLLRQCTTDMLRDGLGEGILEE